MRWKEKGRERRSGERGRKVEVEGERLRGRGEKNQRRAIDVCVWGALRMIRRQVARGRLEQRISNPTSPALRRMSSVSPQRGRKRKTRLHGAPRRCAFLGVVERAGSGTGDAKEKNECSTTRNAFPANSSLPLFLAKQRCGSHGRHAPACLFMQRQRQGHRSGDKRALPCREGGQRG